MKTYVIILSEKFPTTHTRKGQETDFRRLFLNGNKIHTIRANFPLWEKRIAQIQKGEAVLSIRQWTGKPYRSKQVEIARLSYEDGVGIQELRLTDLSRPTTISGEQVELHDSKQTERGVTCMKLITFLTRDNVREWDEWHGAHIRAA